MAAAAGPTAPIRWSPAQGSIGSQPWTAARSGTHTAQLNRYAIARKVAVGCRRTPLTQRTQDGHNGRSRLGRRLGASLDAAQHPAQHGEVTELHEDDAEQGCDWMRPVVARVDSRDQPGSVAVDRRELPQPGAVVLAPQQPVVDLVGVNLQGCPFGRSRGHGHPLPDFEGLEVRDERRRAGMREVVEQVVAVPAGTQATHLDEPRPDGFGGRVDGDGSRGPELRVRDQCVPRHRCVDLGRIRTPAQVPPSVERRGHHGRQVPEDIADLVDQATRGGCGQGGHCWCSLRCLPVRAASGRRLLPPEKHGPNRAPSAKRPVVEGSPGAQPQPLRTRERRSPRRGSRPLAWGFELSRLSESNRRPIHYE